MLDTMPSYLPDQRRRPRLAPMQIAELMELVERPTASCRRCRRTHWADAPHLMCNPRPREEYL